MLLWQKNLYVMFASQLLSTIGFSMIFPFLPNYVAALGSSYGLSVVFLTGAVYSGYSITMAITAPIWGSLADRFGKKLMVERAMYGGAILLFLMAFASSAEMLVLLRTIQGAITGVVGAASALVAANAPRERMGYAMGMIQVSLWSGVSLGPLIGGILADYFGYNYAFFFTAGLLLIGGLMVSFLVQEPEANKTKTRKSINMLSSWKHVLTAPFIPLVFFFKFVNWLSRSVLVPYLPLFVATLLIDQSRLNTLTGLTIALSSAAGTVTAIFFGRLGDKIGHKKILILCSSLTAVCYLFQFWVQSVWQLLGLQMLTGAAAGGIIPVLSALLNQYTEPGQEGAAFGFDTSVTSLSRASAPMIGAIIVLAADLRFIFIFSSLLLGVTALLAYWKLPDFQKSRA